MKEILVSQKIFRILLDCMARPGKIGKINSDQIPEEICAPYSKYTLEVAKTLLDQETSFHIAGDSVQTEAFLSVYTLAAKRALHDCDYLLCCGNKIFEIENLKRGSFQYPDESATVICQVNTVSDFKAPAENSILLKLKGPGIKNIKQIWIEGLNPEFPERWRNCNQEFPLGIDWIIVDYDGNVLCIPRSARF